MPAKPGQSIEKIRAHLFGAGVKGNLPKLTPAENQKMKRYRLIVQEVMERPFQTDAVLRNWIISQFNRKWHQADDDIANVRRIHAVANMGKDLARYTVTEMLKKAYEIAEKRRDYNAMSNIADKLTKAYKLDKDELHEIPWEDIVPPQLIVTGDVRTLGLKPMSDEQREATRKKYMGNVTDAVIIEQHG